MLQHARGRVDRAPGDVQVANAAVDFDGPEHPGHLYGEEDVDPLPMS